MVGGYMGGYIRYCIGKNRNRLFFGLQWRGL
jgi:hypothetical protein